MAVVVMKGNSRAERPASRNLLPEGIYDFKIEGAQIREAKSADKFPSTQLSMIVVGSDNGVGIGQNLNHFLSHSPKSASIVRDFLEQCGCPFEEVMAPGVHGPEVGVQYDTDHLPGRFIRAKVYHDKWNNRTNAKLTEVQVSRFAGGQAIQPPQPQNYPPQGYQAPPQATHQAGAGQAPPRAMPPQGYAQPPAAQPPQAAPQGYPQGTPVHYPPQNNQ